MKKFLYLLAFFPISLFAVQYKYIQAPISGSASLQAGTTTGFYVSSGTVMTLNSTTATIKNLIGTTTNDSACTGCVGEFISSITVTKNFGATSAYGDLVSVVLSSGDWSVSSNMNIETVGTFTTAFFTGISQTSGNSATGLVSGDSRFTTATSTGVFVAWPMYVVNLRESLTASTTIYLKYLATYTGTTPQATGRITAIRVR